MRFAIRLPIARFLLATFAVALLVGSANAQALGGGGRKHAPKSEKPAAQTPKVDDKAYKNALKSLPDKPYDPWHGAR
jgi:hypothetical protein